jgi:hypothetical protein
MTGHSLGEIEAGEVSLDLSAHDRRELANDLADFFDCAVPVPETGEISTAELSAVIEESLGRA